MSEVEDQAAELRGFVAESIGKRRFGVDYGFDVGWTPLQAQTPAGIQMVPCYWVLITRGSPLLGQGPLSHMAQLPVARPTFEQADEQVAEGLRLLAALHDQLKRPPEAPPAKAGPPLALMNGHRS